GVRMRSWLAAPILVVSASLLPVSTTAARDASRELIVMFASPTAPGGAAALAQRAERFGLEPLACLAARLESAASPAAAASGPVGPAAFDLDPARVWLF